MFWTTKRWSKNCLLSYSTLYNHEYSADIEIEKEIRSQAHFPFTTLSWVNVVKMD